MIDLVIFTAHSGNEFPQHTIKTVETIRLKDSLIILTAYVVKVYHSHPVSYMTKKQVFRHDIGSSSLSVDTVYKLSVSGHRGC